MCIYAQTDRTRFRFGANLGNYDKVQSQQIIDEAHFCQLAVNIDNSPYVQATVHWRIGDKIYIHGAVKNKAIHAIHQGAEACLSFTIFDGYVMAQSAINHAVLYRSVIAYSKGRFISKPDEKLDLLETYIESIETGRWQGLRPPTEEELKRTGLIEFTLDEVSLKAISPEASQAYLPGGDYDDPQDQHYHAWTGLIPYQLSKT